MSEITITVDTLRYISLFETMTGTNVKDCIETPEKLIFVIQTGDIGKAIGKKGVKIRKLKELFKKNVQIIEYSSDPVVFITNIFRNYNVKGVKIEERGTIKHATVTVDPLRKGKAIGKNGRNLKLAREIVSRHHDIKSVSVA